MEVAIASKQYSSSIAKDIILTLITFGIYYFFIQYRQINALNYMLKTERYSFLWWLILTTVTFGLYHLYHEYRMSQDLVTLIPGLPEYEGLISLLLLVFGLVPVVDAIQQSHINRYFGSHSL